jgi:very-short-patch-repair endonuclease
MPQPLPTLLATHGGAIATHEFYAAGVTRNDIQIALNRGRLLRARQGWYVDPWINPDLVRAVRVGGRLTCRSALDLQGVWVVSDASLHVVVDGNACQLRSPNDARQRRRASDGTVLHWRDSIDRSRLIADPVNALEDLCSCADSDMVAASADSVLHQRGGERARIAELASRLPASYREALLRCDGVCESGTETLFWIRMCRWSPRRQVRIPGVGRVDFLFGDRLVVEVDGEAYHSDAGEFEKDRNRDARLSALGYRVLRFSYRQVIECWPEVESAVTAAILRRDHR